MIRYNKCLVIICAVLFCPLVGVLDTRAEIQAEQEADLPEPLTLEQCIQLAVDESTDMRNAAIDSALLELRIKNARALYYPELFLNGRYLVSDRSNQIFDQRLLGGVLIVGVDHQLDAGSQRLAYDPHT